jgi:large subunit ribosomal protein L13
MKTLALRPDQIERDWFVVDANSQTVGRLATEIARVLIGKHKPQFSLNQDAGDFVVVLNCDKVHFTGNKWSQKEYIHHSGYTGGLKRTLASQTLKQHPERIIETAVRGMLPKNKHRDTRMTRLKVYTTGQHPHVAQQPKPFPTTK